MGWVWILDKHERTPQHAVKILNSGIIQDPTGSLRILDKIQQNRYLFQSRYYGILEKISNDSTASFQSWLWNPNNSGKDPTELQTRSYEILQDPRESYKIVQESMGWVWDVRKS